MADPITIDDIYALFQRSQAEADRRCHLYPQRLVSQKIKKFYCSVDRPWE